ncbi:MAG: hypothetical protein IKN05_09580, partial [Clostridia bacterium]|nr:hypothetical protein [Clostridia bacterium]
NIGRTLKDTPVDRCVELTKPADGALRQSVKASCSVPGGCRVPSTMEVTYSLDAGSRALRVELKIDWQEQGGETIPVLVWRAPAAQMCGLFRYLIPAGSKLRPALNNDVPGIGGAAALCMDSRALALVSDSKYGYRGSEDALSLTLINSAVNPDPYPERGIHTITLWLGSAQDTAQALQAVTDEMNHRLFYQPGGVHGGALPARFGLVELVSGKAAVTSMRPEGGALTVRGYETAGEDGEAELRVNGPVKAAFLTDLSEGGLAESVRVKDGLLTFPVKAHALFEVRIGM